MELLLHYEISVQIFQLEVDNTKIFGPEVVKETFNNYVNPVVDAVWETHAIKVHIIDPKDEMI